MTNLLSAISGQFSKTLLLSTLLPVTVFVLLALVLVLPWVPATVPLHAWIQSLDAEWKLAAVTLTIVLLTALLHNLNGPVIRFYEGYPWCDSWLGRWRTRVHKRRFHALHSRWHGLSRLLKVPEAEAHPEFEKAVDRWNDLGRRLNRQYPIRAGEVLPTELGNVLRSFESYPYRQYGIRAITVWPRLVARIEPGYAAQIDDAKASVDFMLNSSLLCGAFALLLAVVRLAFPAGLAVRQALILFGAELVLFLILAWVFYRAAIPRAQSWGMLVKGAFDLFRRDLLAALGFERKPASLEEERALWERISERLIFSDLTRRPLPDFDPSPPPPTRAAAAKGAELEIAKGVEPPAAPGGALTVRLRVRNLANAPATGVSVTDLLPDGWAYEWDSASASAGGVRVTGFNPYRFRLGDLPSGTEILLTYRAVAVRQGDEP